MANEPKPITVDDLKLTKDGYSAAVVGNSVYVAEGSDPITIRAAYVDRKPVEEMTLRDFYVMTGTRVEDIAGFVAELEDIAEHHRQLARLGRHEEFGMARKTAIPREVTGDVDGPATISDGVTIYGPGVKFHSTPGHGWFEVDEKANATIPGPYRHETVKRSFLNGNGTEAKWNPDDGKAAWYEEDSDWAKVAVGMPYLFTERELRQADHTLRNWYPDAYEKVNDVVLQPGESRTKDTQTLLERHRNDWIAVSATMSPDREGMVLCTAVVGGRRGWHNGKQPEEKMFLVPKDEYRIGLIGFVIDPERHEELDDRPKPGM